MSVEKEFKILPTDEFTHYLINQLNKYRNGEMMTIEKVIFIQLLDSLIDGIKYEIERVK